MISFLVVIACCAVGALLLSVRIKASPMVNLGLIFLFTSGGIFFHSPYLMGKVVDKYVPMSRPKQIERRLEDTYSADQSGGRANLVVDFKKATADIKTGTTVGLRRLGDPEQMQRAKLILTLAKLGDDSLCGAFFTGDIEANQLNEAVKQLSEEDFEGWAKLLETALQAELQVAPYSKTSDFSFYESFDRIQTSLNEADRDFLKKKFTALSTNKPVTAKDACHATEVLYAGILKTGIPAGPRFMRYQAEPSPTIRNPIIAIPEKPVDPTAPTRQLSAQEMQFIKRDFVKKR